MDVLPDAFLDALEDDLFCMDCLFLCRRRNAFQRIVDPQVFILDLTHGVIRQHVQRLQIIQTADKVTQLPQIVVVQCDARHDHVADRPFP